MSPVQVMRESDLAPYTSEIEEYLEVFNEAAKYFESANTPEVRTELLKWRKTFEDWIRDPRTKYDLYYLDPKKYCAFVGAFVEITCETDACRRRDDFLCVADVEHDGTLLVVGG